MSQFFLFHSSYPMTYFRPLVTLHYSLSIRWIFFSAFASHYIILVFFPTPIILHLFSSPFISSSSIVYRISVVSPLTFFLFSFPLFYLACFLICYSCFSQFDEYFHQRHCAWMNIYALQRSSLQRRSLSLNSPVCYCFFQDREFVEMEVPYNGAPKRPGSPSPLTSPAHSTASRGGLLQSCCGRCYPQRYQVRGRRILASITSISETAPSSSSHSHQSQPGRSHYQQAPVDPTTVPNVVFNVPGDADRQRRQGASSSSPYNETRVWARGKDYRRNYPSHPAAESIAGNRSKCIAQRDSVCLYRIQL